MQKRAKSVRDVRGSVVGCFAVIGRFVVTSQKRADPAKPHAIYCHWNINEELNEKFENSTRKTLNRFTTWNITHNTGSDAM